MVEVMVVKWVELSVVKMAGWTVVVTAECLVV